jgi:hypothetical protein
MDPRHNATGDGTMRNSLTRKPELRELNVAELDNVAGAALLQTSIVGKLALAVRDEFVASFKKANHSLATNPLDRP